MGNAKVPIIPGYHGDNQDPAFLHKKAQEIGYPVMIKAEMGGGGKGMKLCHWDEDFLSLLESAKMESLRSFSDDWMILERFVTKPKHIEV